VRRRVRGALLATLAVLPMLGPLLWEHALPRLRLISDAGLAAVTPVEQPLNVRAFAGQWELLLVLAWFGLAYAQQRAPLWELVLVLLGASLGLARLGNLWLTAVLYVPALASRLVAAEASLQPIGRRGLLVACAAVGLCLGSVASVLASRPPGLPSEAARVLASEPGQATVFTNRPWAGAVQQAMGPNRPVLGAGDLSSEDALDYLRVSLAHANWDALLRQHGVDLVVLDAADAQAAAAAEMRASPDWQVAFDRDGILVAHRVRA
jgi:hypothetical protein